MGPLCSDRRADLDGGLKRLRKSREYPNWLIEIRCERPRQRLCDLKRQKNILRQGQPHPAARGGERGAADEVAGIVVPNRAQIVEPIELKRAQKAPLHGVPVAKLHCAGERVIAQELRRIVAAAEARAAKRELFGHQQGLPGLLSREIEKNGEVAE